MSWLFIAIFAYCLVGLEVVLDKFLLSSNRVAHPATYAFYSGMLSFTTLLIFAPFGVHRIILHQALLSVLSGAIFLYGVLCLFYAINKSEASQVVPVVGAVIPLTTYILSAVFLHEVLAGRQLFGVFILIFGGLLISFDLPLKVNKKKFFSGFYYSIMAGVLIAGGFTWFKEFFIRDNFINVFVWTRMGLFIGALSLLAFPLWRKKIFSSFGGLKKPGTENYKTSGMFVGNKILGGVGSILTNLAISRGSVTIVNALVSVEYVFIFFLSLLFSEFFPSIFKEKEDFMDVFQKIVAIFIITAGIIMISK